MTSKTARLKVNLLDPLTIASTPIQYAISSMLRRRPHQEQRIRNLTAVVSALLVFLTLICPSTVAFTVTQGSRPFTRPMQRDHSQESQKTPIFNYSHRKVCWQLGSQSSSSATPSSSMTLDSTSLYPRWKASVVRLTMIAFIASMCLALPVTLLPQKYIGKLIPETIWPTPQRQRLALLTGQFCARNLIKVFPFCKLSCNAVCATGMEPTKQPEPSIWVCNHTSMLDIFLLLAADKKLRGRQRRPIQIVYWRGLENNPVTKLLFRQSGFIAVEMANNGNGNDNEYDKGSFKKLLKDCKQSIANGFDIGILPEGQLNPAPEKGLLPIFGGAHFLAKLAKRPIQFMALHGASDLWHPDPDINMTILGRRIKAHAYHPGKYFESSDEFADAFKAVVGHFGMRGKDLPQPELDQWLQT